MSTQIETRCLRGPRHVIERGDPLYPQSLEQIPRPPAHLYVLGNTEALQEGIAIVGARKATPYGRGCAQRFARIAAKRGIVVLSGGARGCDAVAHKAALEEHGITVAFLGGGCDRIYPAEHFSLFQRIVDTGGAVVSEHPWEKPALPYQFRERNRLIAGLARATLIVEAGLPSGTFSTADEALAANRDVLVVPGAITAASSRGANRLLYQGALPIIDDETFEDALFNLFGCLKQEHYQMSVPPRENEMARVNSVQKSDTTIPEGFVKQPETPRRCAIVNDPLTAALQAEPLGMDRLFELAKQHCGDKNPRVWLMEHLAEGERDGLFARHPDGRWGPKGE